MPIKISSGLKTFFYFCAAYITCVFFYGYFIYINEKKQAEESIDARITSASKSVTVLLDDGYHDLITEDIEAAQKNYSRVKPLLGEFAAYQKVKYIYTLIEKDGKIYFTSSSELPTDIATKFMDEYDTAPKELLGHIKSGSKNELFVEYTDKWGSFRSVFIPRQTKKGTRYVVAADVAQSELSDLIYKSLLFAVETSFFYLLLAAPGVYFFIRSVGRSKREFTRQFLKDPLTDFDNRFAMIKEINEDKPYALMLLNIDAFRELNDLYGHKTGDKALIQIANNLHRLLRDGVSDIAPGAKLFKLHADEFGILFKEKIAIDKLEYVAKVLLQHISFAHLFIDGSEIALNATVGISYAEHDNDLEDAKYLMTEANIALKEAKLDKKPYLFYDKSMQVEHKYKQNILWINKLKTAFAKDRITPFYQPILNNKTGKIEKYECLVRLIDDEDRIVSPFYFLGISKKSRLYHKITKTVIQKSFEKFAKESASFSINISADDITNPAIVDYILNKLARYKIGDRVIFEILESEGIESYEDVYSFIEKVKEFGCKISIDDFGAGYSNFEHILKLKPNFIKIDGSLIKNIDKDVNAQIIARAIVSFAGELGAETVAEFVHSKEVQDMVTSLKIGYSQGFYIAEPTSDIKRQ